MAATASATTATAPAAGEMDLASMVEGLTTLARVERYMPSAVGGGVRINTVRWEVPSDARVVPAETTAAAATDAGTAPSAPVASTPASSTAGTLPAVLGDIKGGILFCHGYGHYLSVNYDWIASVLARHGIAAFGMEHMGHGKSEGLPGYIPSFDAAVTDVLNWAAVIKDKYLPPGTPLFVYGESLGGGMAIHCALREPAAFAGIVLFAPMVATAEGQAPGALVQALGRIAAWAAPTLAAAPVRDLLPHCFRDESILEYARRDPYRYMGRMRLGTAFQLKDAIDVLSASHDKLATPFLCFHGTGDQITDHNVSKALFDTAPSTDKTLYHYEGACHVLWTESVDTRERILRDLLTWLLDRCEPSRRARLSFPVAAYATRPLGTAPFKVEGHPLTLYNLDTHGHLYSSRHPKDEAEVHTPPADHSIHKPEHSKHHLNPANRAAAAGGAAAIGSPESLSASVAGPAAAGSDLGTATAAPVGTEPEGALARVRPDVDDSDGNAVRPGSPMPQGPLAEALIMPTD